MRNHSIIAHPANEEETSVIKEFFTAHKIKFEVSMEKPYDPEFVRKVLQGKKDIDEGRSTDVKPESLKGFIDSL